MGGGSRLQLRWDYPGPHDLPIILNGRHRGISRPQRLGLVINNPSLFLGPGHFGMCSPRAGSICLRVDLHIANPRIVIFISAQPGHSVIKYPPWIVPFAGPTQDGIGVRNPIWPEPRRHVWPCAAVSDFGETGPFRCTAVQHFGA
jgi:hypothetical protein